MHFALQFQIWLSSMQRANQKPACLSDGDARFNYLKAFLLKGYLETVTCYAWIEPPVRKSASVGPSKAYPEVGRSAAATYFTRSGTTWTHSIWVGLSTLLHAPRQNA